MHVMHLNILTIILITFEPMMMLSANFECKYYNCNQLYNIGFITLLAYCRQFCQFNLIKLWATKFNNLMNLF